VYEGRSDPAPALLFQLRRVDIFEGACALLQKVGQGQALRRFPVDVSLSLSQSDGRKRESLVARRMLMVARVNSAQLIQHAPQSNPSLSAKTYG